MLILFHTHKKKTEKENELHKKLNSLYHRKNVLSMETIRRKGKKNIYLLWRMVISLRDEYSIRSAYINIFWLRGFAGADSHCRPYE